MATKTDREETYRGLAAITRWVTKLVLAILIPPLFVDRPQPLRRRFYRWRYVYLATGGLTLAVFTPTIVDGILWPLALVGVGHVVAPVAFYLAMTTGTVPGIAFPIVPDVLIAGYYLVGVMTSFGFELVRRQAPALFNMTDPKYTRDETEYVLPMDTVEDGTAPAPPRLDQTLSTLLLGETGGGKTNAAKLLAAQFPYAADTGVIVHDYGDEFKQFYRERGFETLRLGVDNSDVCWNLFRDIETERDIREISGAVFDEPAGHNPFFEPAKQVFEGALLYLYREAQAEDALAKVGHDDLIELLNMEPAAIYRKLQRYDDLESRAVQLDPDSGKGATNVYQTLHEYVQPVFTDDFASHGEFSLREYVRAPAGRVLIIDSEPTEMETLGPMYRLLLDWAIRHALATENPSMFILDEIDQLPPLTQATNLAARGRDRNARALIGVQTIGQLRDTYSDISGIVGNCPQGLHFSPGDAETTEYILDEVGETRDHIQRRSYSVSHGGAQARSRTQDRFTEEDRAPFTSGDLKQFAPGDCVVTARTDWWLGRVAEFDDVEHRL